METEDYQEAIRAFERLVLTFPLYENALDARHRLAQSFYRNEDYLSAVSEFNRIAQVYADDERTAEARLGMCRAYAQLSPHPQRDQQFTVQAHSACRNVALDHEGQAVGDSAFQVAREMEAKLAEKVYAEALFYFQRDILESAELVFLELLDSHPETDWAPRAMARLMEIYEEWEWEEQREEMRARLLERYPDTPEARAVSATAASPA